jgi:hypothetical protein
VGQKDGWSWTSWVGIGAVVRAPAPLPHSLCYLFVCLLPGPSGPVALPIAAHYSSFLSLLELCALPGRCGKWAHLELEWMSRAVGATGACGCPPSPAARLRAGPGGASRDRRLDGAAEPGGSTSKWWGEPCRLYQDCQGSAQGAWNSGAANVRAPVNTSVSVLVYGQLVRCGRARLRPT